MQPDSSIAISRHGPAGRYAPSPTGELHLGNLRMALAARDDITNHNGVLILRMEDTDMPRNRLGAAQRIIEDLSWLGIRFDEGPHLPGPGGIAGPYVQSQRQNIYMRALGQLAAAGLVYTCTCSRQMLESAASAPHGPEGVHYPGTCRRSLAPAETAAMLDLISQTVLQGKPQQMPWSVRLNTVPLPPAQFIDELHHPHQAITAPLAGDFVIFRRDGLWAYQFVCAIDDGLMGITRVVRGRDLLSSTPRQVQVMQAMGLPIPVYRHLPLAADPATGLRLSKRDGSQSLQTLRDQGMTRDRVLEMIRNLPDLPE